MFPLKIGTCFSSQSVAPPPKQVCTIVKKKLDFKRMIEDLSKIWHLRYAHLGYASLNFLSNKRMMDDFPSVGESNGNF